MHNRVILFGHTMSLQFGGMEAHFLAFLEYFQQNAAWCLESVVTCQEQLQIHDLNGSLVYETQDLDELCQKLAPEKAGRLVLFFNDGYWIEYLDQIRESFPQAYIMMRSGGNEFVNARIFGSEYTLTERQKRWAQIVNVSTDSVIANSLYTVQRMKDCGFDGSRIVLIRGGIHLKDCEANVAQKEFIRRKVREKYSIQQPYLFVVAARMVEFKGIDLLIDAIGRSRFQNEIYLLAVGDGKQKEELEARCEKVLGSGYYQFVGAMTSNETLELIASADVFCNTSIEYAKPTYGCETYIHTETMGRSMLEAIAQKVPLLATDAGGTRELFYENSYLGELTKADADSLVMGINRLLEQKKEVDSDAGQYDWKKLFLEYETLWNQHFTKDDKRCGEHVAEDRRWSLCCKEDNIFRKYFKYASYEESIREGIFSRIFEGMGVNTPCFLRTWYSTERQMYYNEYDFVDMEPIAETEVFEPQIWNQVQETLSVIGQGSSNALWDSSDWEDQFLPEICTAIERVEGYQGYSLDEMKQTLKDLPKEVLVHGDFSLINLFVERKSSKLVVLDYQNSCLGCRDWDYCYLLSTIEADKIPNSLIDSLTADQIHLIWIISAIKLGRGLRKNLEVEKRESQYRWWGERYAKTLCI